MGDVVLGPLSGEGRLARAGAIGVRLQTVARDPRREGLAIWPGAPQRVALVRRARVIVELVKEKEIKFLK